MFLFMLCGRRVSVLPIWLLLLCSISCSSSIELPEQREAGVLNLNGYDFSESRALPLAYTFDFYWDTLIPATAALAAYPSEQALLPGDWNKIPVDTEGHTAGSYGKATYALQLVFSKDQINEGPLVLQINTVRSAYEAYLNGKKVAQQGQLRPELIKVDAIPQYVAFEPQDTVQLVLHVVNQTTYKGGLVEVMRLGTPDQILGSRDLRTARDTFLMAGLLMIGLYHLILSLAVPHRQVSHLFGLMCLLLVIRTGSTGEHLLVQWLPALPPWFTLRLEYGSLYLAPYVVLMFFKRTFPEEVPAWLVRLGAIVTLAFAITIVSPFASWMGFLLPLCQLLLLTLGPYLIIWGVGRAVWRGRLGAWMFLIGLTALVVAAINDVLYTVYLIDTGLLVSYGLLVLVVCQAVALSIRLNRAFQIVEDLSGNLELRVHERTEELQEKNSLLEEQKTLIGEQHNQLESSLKYAWRIQQAVLGEERKLQEMFLDSFLFFKPRGIVSGDFYWFGQLKTCKIVALGDVTGQGAPAAFLTIMTNAFFNHIVYEHRCTDAAEILRELDAHLRTSFQRAGNQLAGARLSILIIDEVTGAVDFAGASQSLYTVQDQAGGLVSGSENVVGISAIDAPAVRLRFSFQGKDQIFLFTNGFAQQMGSVSLTPLGDEAFLAVLEEASILPLQEQANFLDRKLLAWKGEQELTDDIAIIGIRV
ncbi:MAG: 7TM diverse intracellular signaling domain-containing protein [Bacteroidota bacterium]